MASPEPDRRMLGLLLRQPLRAMLEELHRGMARAGYLDLRPAHSAVFMNLDPQGTRISDLAERAQMTKQSMGELVRYLQERGYVSIKRDPTDGRARLVLWTEKGRATEGPARKNIQLIQQKWGRRLDRGEMEQLIRLLRKLGDLVAKSDSR